MWKQWSAALAAGLLAACALAQGAAPVRLDTAADEFGLIGHLEWLEDESAGLTLADVRTAQTWTALPGILHSRITRSAIWLRLTLVQPVNGPYDLRLSVDETRIDEIQLHYPLPGGGWQVQRAGSAVMHHEWPLNSRIPTFRLQLPPGQHTVYLRLQSQHTLSAAVRLQSINGYMKRNSLEALAFGGYFGIFFVALLLQLAFWVVGREAVSGWYLLFSSVALISTVLRSGYPQMSMEPAGLLSPIALVVFTILAPMAVVRLTAVWLQLRRHLPRVNVIYQSGSYLVGLLAASMALVLDPVRALEMSQIINILLLAVSLAIGVWMWRSKQGDAGYYLLVFGVIDLGILVRFIRNLGGLPVSFATDYAVYIATAIHLILMSLYSIHRYNKLQTELRLERRAREEQKEFVGMVSHEFRTPLAIINTSIQQLAANLEAPAEKSLQRAKNIRDAVQRMNLLLDDYLSLDRMDSARQPVRTQPCDFYEVIEEAAADWPLGRVRIRMHDLPTPFICDPDLMRIVLRNLLANAVRHSPEDTMIELEASGRTDGGLLVRVQDWGEGIPPDELPKLFQRYFRGRASQGKPGAGLGLHLVQRIVQAHGGTISVQSTPGQGSTFTVTLPPGRPAKD